MDANQSQTPGSQPDTIPIAQICPTVENLSGSLIHATVTLLWPYSSSTKSLGLLLAEPDFRLRRSNGQVKVIFHGHIAESVAESKLGIGDDVFLSLGGARFVDNQATTQTTGKCVTWDLHFDNRLLLEVFRASECLATVKVDPPSSPVPDIHVTSPTPVTPTPKIYAPLDEIPSHAESWQSPAFIGRTRTSFGGLVNSAFDPFTEEDGYVPGKGRKRPRFSMRGSEWRVIDEPDVPGDDDMPLDWTHIFDEAELSSDGDREETAGADQVAAEIPQPHHGDLPVPVDVMDTSEPGDLSVPAEPSALTSDKDAPPAYMNESPLPPGRPVLPELPTHVPVETPRLHPIPSPGLPVPSPLVTTPSSQSGYFGSVETTGRTQCGPVASKLSQEVPRPEDKASLHVQEEAAEDLGDRGTNAFIAASSEISTAAQAIQMSQSTDVAEKIIEGTAQTETTQLDGSENRIIETQHIKDDEESDIQDSLRDTEEEEVLEESRASEHEEQGSQSSEVRMEEEESEGESANPKGIQVKPTSRDQGSSNAPEIIESDSDEGSEIAESLEDNIRGTKRRGTDSENRPTSYEGDEYSIDEADRYDYDEDEDEEEVDENTGAEGYDQFESGDEVVESDYDDEYESEDEADEMDVENDIRQPPQTGPPEVIVLDSDSEDEAPPKHQPSQSEQTHIPAITQARRSPVESEEDDYMSNEGGVSSEADAEEWSEVDGSQEDENQEYELEDRRFDVGSTKDESMADQYSEAESVENDWPENEHMENRPIEDERIEEDHIGKSYAEAQSHMGAEHAPITLSEHDEDDFDSGHDSRPLQGEIDDVRPNSPLQNDQVDGASKANLMDQLDIVNRPEPSDNRLPIDPELYDSTPAPEGASERTSYLYPENDDQQQTEAKSSSDKEQGGEERLAFSLHGASPPHSYMPNHTIGVVPVPPQQGQILTPDPSQLSDIKPVVNIMPSEKPPTPLQTQDTSIQEHDFQPAQTADSALAHITERNSPLPEAMDENNVFVQVSEKQHLTIEDEHVHKTTEALVSHNDEIQQTQHHVEDDESVGTIDSVHLLSIDRHYPGLRSKLSYFAPLSTLIDHFNSLTDTISIVSEVLPVIRATSGKKDYLLTVKLTDPSMAGTTLNAEIFRPYKAALPSPGEGDAILLRNFMVRSFNHSMVLVSVATSSWAVFSSSKIDAQVDGPPVEYGAEEQTHATDLRQWYQEAGMAMVADNQLQASIEMASRELTPASSVALSDTGSIDSAPRDTRADSSVSARGSRRRKSRRRITIHELRDGTRYTEVGSPSGRDSIHELRDGTVYANL
ncbi:hypothetical protein BDV59DRAFT_175630 [Aspergillus ambiguus]|uniref:uncharacterized protein n=1 Tax=Aspergillus ambiguus TaxID=176160 RepID=UPI003CCD9839